MQPPDIHPAPNNSSPVYAAADLERFMQAYSYALGLAEAGDIAAGRALLQEGIAALHQRPEAIPGALLDLWEVGLERYLYQFRFAAETP